VTLRGRLRGPLRVVAGAGTGKTEVIARRFLDLVAAGVEPGAILVMTFTERAAGEMRARIEGRLTQWSGELWIGTFHSIAQRLLREEGWRVAVPPGFRVLAGADRWIAMRELLWRLGDEALVGAERPDDLVGPLLRLLERLKQELVPVPRLAAWARQLEDREQADELLAAVRLFGAYERYCREQRLLDFDDLILRLVGLLGSDGQVRAGFVKRFTALLVDEYQDSNLAQERMVELLGGGRNVCVVGDDDQAIYRFRGASLASLERFTRAFPGARTLRLGRNHRSSGAIVAAAAALIAGNPLRIDKPLTSGRRTGSPVELWRCSDGLDEALAIAEEAKALALAGTRLDRIAILLRTNALGRPIVAALRAAGIPHQLWGARGFYRRPEILDVIAYFRVVLDPADEVALARLAARPGAGLPAEEALERLRLARVAERPPLSAFESWPPAAAWLAVVEQLIVLAARSGVDELFFELMNRTRYLEAPGFESEAERRQAAANLGKFAELIEAFCERSRDHSLRAFMAYLDLVLLSEADEEVAQADEVEEAVQVMTIHQAKGLEFDAVFIPAVVEGRLPQSRRGERYRVPAPLVPESAGPEDQEAEERRLLYVAMTRARDRLYLSYAARYDGSRAWRRSRFIGEALAGADGWIREVVIPPLAGAQRLGLPNGDRKTVSPANGQGRGEPLSLSFTAISTYRDCPRQYRYRYVHRLPARPTAEGVYGTVVHQVLMEGGRALIQGRAVDAELLGRLQAAAWATTSFPDPRRLPAMKRLAEAQLKRYLEAGGLARPPAMVERAFTLEMTGWRLRGVIDRVDPPESPGGPWLLIDYKSGAAAPASRLRRDLQLLLYALAARRVLALDPLQLRIVYLRSGSTVSVEASDDLVGEAETVAAEVAESVLGGDFEPRPERRRCSLCPYRLACPDAL
jgi:DNA helicase-2/ATP-dependent DNA helicase PcrA